MSPYLDTSHFKMSYVEPYKGKENKKNQGEKKN